MSAASAAATAVLGMAGSSLRCLRKSVFGSPEWQAFAPKVKTPAPPWRAARRSAPGWRGAISTARPGKPRPAAVPDTWRTLANRRFDIIGLFPLPRPPIREQNRRIADVAGHGLGRLNWADFCRSPFARGPTASHQIPDVLRHRKPRLNPRPLAMTDGANRACRLKW